MMMHRENDRAKGDIGVTEGVRRTTGVTPIGAHLGAPDPEVVEKKPRRRFTAQYKLRILEEAEACTESGQIGALLRREGLYSSNLTAWRRQRDDGQLQALSPKKRGRKQKPKNPLAERVAQLERETRRLEHRLKQAQTIIEVQKKYRTSWGSPNRNSTTTGAAHEGGHGLAHRGRNHTGM
jgi:transposase-like protein